MYPAESKRPVLCSALICPSSLQSLTHWERSVLSSLQDIRALDNISFTDWFISHGGSMQSIKRMWDPIGE